jgi:hypothetical protein
MLKYSSQVIQGIRKSNYSEKRVRACVSVRHQAETKQIVREKKMDV